MKLKYVYISEIAGVRFGRIDFNKNAFVLYNDTVIFFKNVALAIVIFNKKTISENLLVIG